jgi:hypothetical protein
MLIDVAPPDRNFRGLSYGEWITVWNNWLLSRDPDSYDGGDVLFLRGNINYKPVSEAKRAPRHIDPHGIYDRTGDQGEQVFEGTAIFFPVIDSMMKIGDMYDGKVMKKIEELRLAVNKDINEGGPMWATIMKKGGSKASKIVKNIEEYRVESTYFKLHIPEDSLLKDKTEYVSRPGVYDAVSGGYFIMIGSLPSGLYRINFGAKGRGVYRTNAVYDILVQGRRKGQIVDKSNFTVPLKW